MSNEYSSDPPVAARQLLVISDKINDISKNMDKLAEMPQKLDRMNMQLEQLNKEHQQTQINKAPHLRGFTLTTVYSVG